MQADSLHLALWAADNGMTTNDPFAARYDETALAAERQTALDALDAGTPQSDTLYLFEDEGAFLQSVEPVKALAWCGRVTSADGSASWYAIAPGLQGQTFDALCTPYDEDYPCAWPTTPTRCGTAACWTRQSRRSALRIPRLRVLSWTVRHCFARAGRSTRF